MIHGKNKSFTLLELMVSILLAAPIAGSLVFTLIFTMRAQATFGDQALIRATTDSIMQKLAQDIRNTSASSYNSEVWQFPVEALEGEEVEDGEDELPGEMTLRLFDSTNGYQIIWLYDRETNVLTRSYLDLSVANATPIQTEYAKLAFSDLIFEEQRLQDYAPNNNIDVTEALDLNGTTGLDGGFVYEAQWDNIDDASNLTLFRVTAITVRGRSLSRITSRNSILNDFDANDDGDLRDDAVGAAFFGRNDQGDDPAWQYIYNFSVAFRNS